MQIPHFQHECFHCLLGQIAILKAASARKDGEWEQFHQSANSIPETPKSKSLVSSIARSSTSSHGNRKPPREDSSSTVEVTYSQL